MSENISFDTIAEAIDGMGMGFNDVNHILPDKLSATVCYRRTRPVGIDFKFRVGGRHTIQVPIRATVAREVINRLLLYAHGIDVDGCAAEYIREGNDNSLEAALDLKARVYGIAAAISVLSGIDVRSRYFEIFSSGLTDPEEKGHKKVSFRIVSNGGLFDLDGEFEGSSLAKFIENAKKLEFDNRKALKDIFTVDEKHPKLPIQFAVAEAEVLSLSLFLNAIKGGVLAVVKRKWAGLP